MNKKKEKPLCVVILPVYNTENYLEECLNSFINQTYKNFLVFAIDDGSTDKSLSILNKYQNLDNRFMVYSIKHGGVSSARNFALDKINSLKKKIDLLCFTDSDDYVSSNFIESYVSLITNKHVDSVICGYQEFDKKGPIPENKMPSFLNNRIINQKDYIDILLNYNSYKFVNKLWCPAFLANRCFRFDKVKDIRFNQKLSYGEDTDWIIKATTRLESAFISSEINYFYRQRQSSLSHSSNAASVFQAYLLETYPKIFIERQMFSSWWNCVINLYIEGKLDEHYQNLIKVGKNFFKVSLTFQEKKRLLIATSSVFILNIYLYRKYRKSPLLTQESQPNSHFP